MIEIIRQKMALAAKKIDKSANDITLIAVSKQQPDDRIKACLDEGHRIFGENRVQEAKQHWQERRCLYPDLHLHLIGPLQSNKVSEAVSLFDVIHTIDRPKIAKAIYAEMTKQNRKIEGFIQINTGAEPQKAGILPENLSPFLSFCRDEAPLSIIGLMCIPPVNEEAAMHFALLRTLADRHGLNALSMGMSGDYEEAIGFGASHIRIGSALFGERLASKNNLL